MEVGISDRKVYRVSWYDRRIDNGDLEFNFDVRMTEAEAAALGADMHANEYILGEKVETPSDPVDLDFLRRNNPEIWRLGKDPDDPLPGKR